MIARGTYQERIWWLLQQGESVVVPEAPRYRNNILHLLSRVHKAGYKTERTTEPDGRMRIRLGRRDG